MLTRKYILKVARLLDQTGEPRPGYDDGQSCLAGQTPVHGISGTEETHESKHKQKMNPKTCVKLKLDYEVDTKTGDIRIVKS